MADSGCLRVSQILVNKASGDSVLQVLGNKARKNCQIVPVLPMYRVPIYILEAEIVLGALCRKWGTPKKAGGYFGTRFSRARKP